MAAAWYGYQFIALQWFFIALTLFMVCTRLYVRLTTTTRPYREILLISAWLTLLAYGCFEIYLYKTGYLDYYGGALTDPTQFIPKWLTIEKVNFVVDFFTWTVGTNFCRILMILSYHDLCPRHVFPKIFWLTVACWISVGISMIGVELIYTFLMCYPNNITAWWAEDPKACPGFIPKYVFTLDSSLALSDILVYTTPIIIIFQLRNLSTISKIGAATMFAIGFINVFSMVAYFGIVAQYFNYANTTHAENGAVMFLQLVQLPTAIMVCCVPQMKVYGKLAWVKRIVEKIKPKEQKPEVNVGIVGHLATYHGPEEQIRGENLRKMTIGDVEKEAGATTISMSGSS